MMLSWVLNFANSIVGVGVLAIPFCFQECGIVLASAMTLLSAYFTKWTCEFLLRAANYTRRTSYEQIAFHLYGSYGKLITEICSIGLLLGTLVAFQVVIGDLAPSIVRKTLGVEETWSLRILIMVLSSLLMAPLCMTRQLSSLASLNAISMAFYALFIFIVVLMALKNFFTLAWVHQLNYWKWSGFFHSLPIISLSFSCQTQVFVMYGALPDPTMKTMTDIINRSVDLVSAIYLTVGIFGYLAFYQLGVNGDILANFPHGYLSDSIKIGFWLSVLVSFALIVFPVRLALNSLLFSNQRRGIPHEVITSASDYISPEKFNLITVGILFGTLLVGVIVPHVETVLAVTGALMGTFLCFVVPSVLLLTTRPGEKLKRVAQVIFLISTLSMVFSTLAVLSGREHDGAELRVVPLEQQSPKRPPGARGDGADSVAHVLKLQQPDPHKIVDGRQHLQPPSAKVDETLIISIKGMKDSRKSELQLTKEPRADEASNKVDVSAAPLRRLDAPSQATGSIEHDESLRAARKIVKENMLKLRQDIVKKDVESMQLRAVKGSSDGLAPGVLQAQGKEESNPGRVGADHLSESIASVSSDVREGNLSLKEIEPRPELPLVNAGHNALLEEKPSSLNVSQSPGLLDSQKSEDPVKGNRLLFMPRGGSLAETLADSARMPGAVVPKVVDINEGISLGAEVGRFPVDGKDSKDSLSQQEDARKKALHADSAVYHSRDILSNQTVKNSSLESGDIKSAL